MPKNHCVECGISSSEVSVPVDHAVSVQLGEFMRVYSLENSCGCTTREMI